MDEKSAQLIAEWKRKADHDRGIAQLALNAQTVFTDGVCFHAQQAAEKDLKACCIALGINFERKHDMRYLLDLIADKKDVTADMYDWAEQLQQYAVEVQYPEAAIDPTVQEAQTALETSLCFRTLLNEVIDTVSSHPDH